MRLKTRLGSLLLCGVLLCSLLPLSAFAAGSKQLTEIAEITKVELYEGTTPTTETLVTGKDYLIKNANQMLLYYEFNIAENASLLADTPYAVPIPTGLKITVPGSEELKLSHDDGTTSKFATLNWDASGASLTFTEEFVNDDHEVTGTHFYFGCAFDKSAAPKVDGVENRYNIEFTTGTTVTVGLDAEEIREQAAELTKKVEQNSGDPNLLTWTITYTPYQNTEKTGFQIRDTLGKGMSPAFLDTSETFDSSKVTVKRGSAAINDAKLEYDSTTRTLTVSNMGEDKTNWEQPITITYPTKIDTALSLPKPNSDAAASQGGTLTNQAVLWGKESADGELKPLDIRETATYKLAKTTYLSKEVKKVEGDVRLLRWTVTVDRGAIPAETTITLTDTLPNSLELVTADSAPAKQPTLNGNPQPLPVDATTKSFSLMLNDSSFVSGKAILVYDTKVKEAFYETGGNLGTNTAKLDFTIDGVDYTPTVTVGVGKGAGVSTAPLTKVNQGFDSKKEGYLRSARSSQWTVTINPNKAELSNATLTDDFGSIGKDISCHTTGHTSGSSLNWDVIPSYWDGGIRVKFDGAYSGNVTIQKANWTGNTCSIVANGANDVQIGTGTSLLTLTENNGKLEFKVGDVGKTSIAITYVTKLNDPCAFAGNITQHKTATNTVRGTMKLGSQELSGLESNATADVSSQILKKETPIYDYTSGQIQWTVTVNESGMPLGDVVLTDTLAAGLTYVDGSLRVNGAPPAAAITATQTGQLFTINLGVISAKTTVTFRTRIDPDKLGFGKATNVSLLNSIEMSGNAFGEKFNSVSSDVNQAISNHGLHKSGTLNKDNEQIEYSVTINLFHVPLTDAFVTDTLPAGLRLDPDTVKLHHAALTGNTGSDGKGAPTAAKGTEVTEGWSFTTNAADNSFTVKLPNGTDAYVLTYAADILDMTKNQSYSNKIAFNTGAGASIMGGEKQNSVAAGGGGGGGGGAASSQKGSLTLTKQGENGDPLSGVTFTLYLWDTADSKRGMSFSQGVTDSAGKLTFKALKLNKSYELVETTPAGYQAGYKLVGTMPAGVTKNADGNLVIAPTAAAKQIELTLKNSLVRGSIPLKVVNKHQIPLPDAEFTLYEDEGCTKPINPPVTSDQDGNVKFPALPYKDGKPYYFKQTKAPGKYIRDTVTYKFTIGPDGTPSPIQPVGEAKDVDKVENDLPNTVKGKLTVIKRDSGDTHVLSGAEFALYDNEHCTGSPLATRITDASGQAVFENLEPDRPMWLKETNPPMGYQADGSVKKLQIHASGPLEITETVENTALPSGGIGGGSDGGTQSPKPNKPNPDAPAAPPSQEPPIQPEAPAQPNVPAQQPGVPAQPGDLNADASNRTDRRDPPADLENSKTEAAKLPQTGQLWWPVWLLTAVGVLMLTGGLAARKRYVGKREK